MHMLLCKAVLQQKELGVHAATPLHVARHKHISPKYSADAYRKPWHTARREPATADAAAGVPKLTRCEEHTLHTGPYDGAASSAAHAAVRAPLHSTRHSGDYG